MQLILGLGYLGPDSRLPGQGQGWAGGEANWCEGPKLRDN